MTKTLTSLLVLAIMVPGYARASEEAAAIIDTMQQKEQWRAANSPMYYVVKESYSIGGRSFSIFEKLSDQHGYWHVPLERVLEILESPNPTDGELSLRRRLHTVAGNTYLAGLVIVSEAGQGLNPSERELRNTLFAMMHVWTDRRRKLPGEFQESQQDTMAVRGNLSEFGSKAELFGPIDFHGRSAHYLLARDLGESETTEDDDSPAYRNTTFTIDEAGLWIDTQHHVILGMRFVGRYSNEGARTVRHPFEIMQTLHDYSRVPESELYLPRRKQMQVRLGPSFRTAAENLRNAETMFDQEIEEMRAKRASGEISDVEYTAFMRRMSTDGMAVLDKLRAELATVDSGVVGIVEYVKVGEAENLQEMLAEALLTAGD